MHADTQAQLFEHVARLRRCRRCRTMCSRPVPGPPVFSRVMIVGQAPGEHEPEAKRPFAWTAGKTLFGWFAAHCGMDEETVRSRVYFAAVCRCFPGKELDGTDREPTAAESARCVPWLEAEFEMLRPRLVIPVGKLAIGLFLGDYGKLVEVVGQRFRVTFAGVECDAVPLPHPSGASPWHRTEPGATLLLRAMGLIAAHPAVRATRG